MLLGWELNVLILLGVGLVYLLAYIYLPKDEPDQRRIPPEFLRGDNEVDDPFRSPEHMKRRLEDFGRFNTRYNQADGVFPGLPFLRRFAVWWRRGRR